MMVNYVSLLQISVYLVVYIFLLEKPFWFTSAKVSIKNKMLKIRLIKKIKKILFVAEAHKKYAIFQGLIHFEGAILQKNSEIWHPRGWFFRY